MKQLQLILTLCLGLLLSNAPFLNAQCTQTNIEGIDFQVNCGGDDCASCLPILYSLICEEGAGVFYVFVVFPENVWTDEEANNGYYLEITGDYQDTFDETNQIINFQKIDGEGVFLQVTKFDSNDNIVAFGEINEASPPCVKGSELEDCPDPDAFNTSQETIMFEESFMTRIVMQGGVAPYQIYDNVNGQFYNASIYEPEFYLGNFPYYTTLSITVIDAEGCTSNFFTSAVPPGPTDDTDSTTDTPDGTTDTPDDGTLDVVDDTDTPDGGTLDIVDDTDTPDGGTLDIVDDSDGTTGVDDVDGGTLDEVDVLDSTDSGDGVAIDEIEEVKGFTLQKNPISLGQNINLKFSNNFSGTTTIELYDVKGQLQFNTLQLKNIVQGQVLPMPLVKSVGTYIVKVQNGADVYVQKIVVL